MSYLDIIMTLFIVLFFAYSRPIGDDILFGRESTATLKGLAMLGIILHHIHRRLGLSSPVLSQVGYLATGLFFFISGYGNMLSLNKKNNIDIKWFLKKLLKIYIPFLVAYCYYFIFYVIFLPVEVPTTNEGIYDLITISLPNQDSWFPKIIVLCYLVHYIARRAIHSEKMQFGAVSLILCLYVVFMYKRGMGSFWYDSVLCYPAGIFSSLTKDRLFEFVNTIKKRYALLICSIIVFGVLFEASRIYWPVKLLCALAFSVMCFVYTSLFKIKTKVMAWIGNNSFEFYLAHVICIQLLFKLIPINYYFCTLFVFAGTFLAVFIYLLMRNKIRTLYN